MVNSAPEKIDRLRPQPKYYPHRRRRTDRQVLLRDGAEAALHTHNVKVVGSSPTPATTIPVRE